MTLKRKDIRQIFTHKTYKTNEKVFQNDLRSSVDWFLNIS